MQIGIARKDITPSVGLDLSGFIAREGPCTGVHDPLYLTALVAEEDGKSVALISCDLIGLGAALVRRVRERVATRTGIPTRAQLYACTHTHAGPETGVITSLGEPDPTYLAGLEDALVAVVEAAASARQPAILGWLRGESHAAHNRVLKRAGQDDTRIDPEVLVARVSTPAGEPIGTILHYTCHPVAAGPENRLASADWCGVVRQQLEEAGSGPVVVVNGAGGDINPRMERRGFAAVGDAGQAIAEVATRLWQDARPVDAVDVAADHALVPLTMLPPAGPDAVSDFWEAWQTAQREHPVGSVPYRSAMVIYRDHARRLTRLHWGSELVPQYHGETQALRVGPLAIVSLPGEFFSAYGMRIKASSPAPATLIAGWANDNLGYFPTAEAFPIGGYEMDTASRYYGYPAPWSPEAGAAVAERAIQLVKELYPP
ncbi:MAG TPA: neutral/alkaline non-lysosomal ceramidase N-terminal domain-containing protein [Chloroflexota bacterium]|nr:neutral/alkaline non-lysosomal ceramidase N-terminal domain-containing protein [Chloroflexota bacterium]